ncbi:metallophosphoesterase [Paenibacillus sp. EKM202P]|uniref:metallophosphoesterase family protein n=1 Tax=unclassified Paenibacillus TaxID=185978 RepID=UPI0013ECBAEE|nr:MULTISPECIES: metallophosphoesterase [unclassified Paenibacillus]KAF6561244.1 metallophosphoesterase [Paenibacillus sp. EKM202P]KAF6566120.1 metallophosphoesterase [Paenibacillus sp. EKM207P]
METNFIQISDIHHHFSNYDSLKMRMMLVRYLKELSQGTRFDFVLITGDLCDKGAGFNNEIIDFLDLILSSLNLTRKDIFIVPGNHDLKRNVPRKYVIEGIKASLSKDELDEALNTEDTKGILLESFKDFFEFYKEYTGEEYPRESLHFIKTKGNCNIIHLNTCLTAYTSKEEGTLLIGRQKLIGCLSALKSDSSKINIAIGHHTIDCFHPDEVTSIVANFDDFGIDMYLSGHVHKPKYHVEANVHTPYINLVSGATHSDDYAVGGFISAKVAFDSHEMEVVYHKWYNAEEYWTTTNDTGRLARSGTLKHKLKKFEERAKQPEVVDLTSLKDDIEDKVRIDEDEFKQFIIDFHQHPKKKGEITSNQTKQKEIEEKFENMRCSPSFEKMFLDYAQYFTAIEEILNSTSYIEADKKEIVSELVIETYLGIHNKYDSGDVIFTTMVDAIQKQYSETLSYSPAKTRRYIRILICWSIYDCNIFNENKVEA